MATEWQDGWTEYQSLINTLLGCLTTHTNSNPPSNKISELLFESQEDALTQARDNAATWKDFSQSYQEIIIGLNDEKSYLSIFKSIVDDRVSLLSAGSVEKQFSDEWVRFIADEITLLDDLKTELERLTT